MNSNTIIFPKEEAKILFLLIPFFPPGFISSVYDGSMVDNCFNIWRVLAFLIVLFLYVGAEGVAINFALLIVIAYEGVLGYSCLYNDISLFGRLIDAANFIGIVMLFNYFSRKCCSIFIKTIFDWGFFCIIVNLFLTIVFPRGLNRTGGRINFLGHDNMISLPFLFFILVGVFYSNIYPNSKKAWIIFVITCCLQVYYSSGSGIVSFAFVLVGYLYLIGGDFWSKYLKPAWMFGFFILGEIFLLIYNRMYNITLFFIKWLGKDQTFSTRTYYWATAIRQISKSPYWGIGKGTVDLWSKNKYSHNAILDVAMKGGIVGLIFWLLLIIVFIKNINKTSQNIHVKSFANIILFAVFLVGLMEGLEDRNSFMGVLAILNNINIFEQEGILKDIVIKKRFQSEE